MTQTVATRVLLVGCGAMGFLVLSWALARPGATPMQPPTATPATTPGASPRAEAATPSSAEIPAEVPAPTSGQAKTAPSADPSRLTNAERAEVLGRAHQLMLENVRGLDQTDFELERYLQSWCAVAKLQAVPAKLERGDYTVLPPLDLFSIEGETTDQTIMAFTIHRGVVRFDFARASDKDVFAVIDACATNQQASWDSEVKSFNSKPETEREQLIAAHRQAEAELARIQQELSQSGESNRLELARTRSAQLRKLQDSLLPYYMVLPKKGNTAWARRSIGR